MVIFERYLLLETHPFFTSIIVGGRAVPSPKLIACRMKMDVFCMTTFLFGMLPISKGGAISFTEGSQLKGTWKFELCFQNMFTTLKQYTPKNQDYHRK